ncbi:hypothetical protein A4D02_35445 [Niastella koreensis]|uniref:Uncharacterized protein n=2 Tax=Niastella koreensis TaxID=354356 RepID=G8TJG4_NIAKG|nr:hypothetical protein [Niastella koreensis]AEV99699.1 hypothetical protein Niako_3393 [Niastella koreensis GR20-10]OQP44274.1 hypothetical protein A4D02_35445 [Niastella koreensis]
MLYYKDEFTDFCMNHKTGFLRYAGLARKAISHYLGNRYNPEEFDPAIEFLIRQCIAGWVELKVFDKEPYDWPSIDNFLRYVLNDDYPDITYDRIILDKGYNGVMRGELPKHHA